MSSSPTTARRIEVAVAGIRVGQDTARARQEGVRVLRPSRRSAKGPRDDVRAQSRPGAGGIDARPRRGGHGWRWLRQDPHAHTALHQRGRSRAVSRDGRRHRWTRSSRSPSPTRPRASWPSGCASRFATRGSSTRRAGSTAPGSRRSTVCAAGSCGVTPSRRVWIRCSSVADTVVVGRIRAEAFERAAVSLIGVDPDVAALFDAYSYERVFEAVVIVTRELAVRGLNVSTDRTRAGAANRGGCCFARSSCSPTVAQRAMTTRGPRSRRRTIAAGCARLLDRALELREAALDERHTIMDLASIVGRLQAAARRQRARGRPGRRARREARRSRAQVGAALVAPSRSGPAHACRGSSRRSSRRSRRERACSTSTTFRSGPSSCSSAHPRLAGAYRERFRLVMIDEFQDTDALQLRLVEALSQGDLCTVGDEKQSIYRFRGADIDVYRQHRVQMAQRRRARGLARGQLPLAPRRARLRQRGVLRRRVLRWGPASPHAAGRRPAAANGRRRAR